MNTDIKQQINEEIGNTVLSLGEWAKQKDNRIAFVVCGEIGDDIVLTVNSLIGRSDRIARALYGNAVENKDYKNVLELAAEMLKNPMLAALITANAADKGESGKFNGDFKDALIGLLETLTEKIKNSDSPSSDNENPNPES